jgi:FkbH-like protein
MVFFDDNPAERQIVKEVLPQVEVPDFPDRPEDLAWTMADIWRQYFNRPVLTNEDQKKTEQYVANARREELKEHAGSFEDYLEGLDIVLTRKLVSENVERIIQLLNKTNQFNLTTKRHTGNEIQEMINSSEFEVFAYQAEDRFGDNGIIAVSIIHYCSEIPVIEEFVMSCRVMGRNIEYAIIDDIEQYLMNKGYSELIGVYKESAKNMPVSELYDRLGYEVIKNEMGSKEYRIVFANKCQREYRLKKKIEKRKDL